MRCSIMQSAAGLATVAALCASLTAAASAPAGDAEPVEFVPPGEVPAPARGRPEKPPHMLSTANEECWENGPNLTYPTALSCSVTDQHAYALEVGGIEHGRIIEPPSSQPYFGTQWVKELDMATQDLWTDAGSLPYHTRGFTACSMFRNQLVVTNASADANSPTGVADKVYFIDTANWTVSHTAFIQIPRRRAAMASVYNYTYIIGGVDANGDPVTTVERRGPDEGNFEAFAQAYPVCDCAVAVHDCEIFLVCSNCSTGALGQVGERRELYTVCLITNTMRKIQKWRDPPNAGSMVSISGATIAQYAVFLVFYTNSTDPIVNYYDLYLEQLHQINTSWLTTPRTHGSAFVSRDSLWYAGGYYFPKPNELTNTLTKNTDRVPVMQKVSFSPLNKQVWRWNVGDQIEIGCPRGYYFRLSESPRCLTPVAGTPRDLLCQGVDHGILLTPQEPANAYGCMSAGTCQVPLGERISCGPPGIKFRECNRAYGCCYDSEHNQCFQYAAANASQRLYYQCAELDPLQIIGTPKPAPTGTPPLTAGPSPTPAPKSAASFLHTTTGSLVLGVSALVFIVGVAGGVYILQRSTRQRHIRSMRDASDDMDLIHGKYHVIRKLGQGGFGTVYLVRRKTDGREFALKYIPCNNDEDRAFALKEFELVRQSQGHPNMITIHDMFMNWADDEETRSDARLNLQSGGDKKQQQLASPLLHANRRFVCIVMTFCPGGDLAHFIVNSLRTGTTVPQEWMLQILARQMISVLDHLHTREKPIVHRDLKPENVLLSTDRSNIVLTDFGLAQEQMRTYMSTRAGSLHYVAPECWKKHYSAAVDMWAVGCILYATATGRATANTARVMFHDAKERGFQKEIRMDLTKGTNNRYTDEFASFVLALLQVDHRKRLTAIAALNWLNDLRDGIPRRPSGADLSSSSSSPSRRHSRRGGASTPSGPLPSKGRGSPTSGDGPVRSERSTEMTASGQRSCSDVAAEPSAPPPDPAPRTALDV